MNAVRSIFAKLNGLDDSQLASSSSSQPQPSVLRAPDAAAKKLFEVMEPIVVSTKYLDFGPLSHEFVEREITLTNPNRSEYPPMAWKALTNLQFCYCVRPNMGVLKSGESVVVTLIREQATRLIAKDGLTRRPAFLFKSTPILEEWYYGNRHTLWQHLPSLSDHLTFAQIKITGNPPGPDIPLPSSPSASPSASPVSPGAEAVGEEDPAAELARLRAENALLRMTVQGMSALTLFPRPLAQSPGGFIANINRAYPPGGPQSSSTTPPPLGSSSSSSSQQMSSTGPPATLFPLTLPNPNPNATRPSNNNASGSPPLPRPLSASDLDWEDAAPSYEEAIAQSAASGSM